jgi:hypothetical protein
MTAARAKIAADAGTKSGAPRAQDTSKRRPRRGRAQLSGVHEPPQARWWPWIPTCPAAEHSDSVAPIRPWIQPNQLLRVLSAFTFPAAAHVRIHTVRTYATTYLRRTRAPRAATRRSGTSREAPWRPAGRRYMPCQQKTPPCTVRGPS